MSNSCNLRVCADLSVTAMSRWWVGGAPAPATEMTGTATEMKRKDSEKKNQKLNTHAHLCTHIFTQSAGFCWALLAPPPAGGKQRLVDGCGGGHAEQKLAVLWY